MSDEKPTVVVRDFDKKKDYAEVAMWWAMRKFPICPLRYLPPNGLIVEVDGKGLCAAWLMISDAGACSIGHFASNPKTDKSIRGYALDMLIASLIERATHLGFDTIGAATSHGGLGKRLEKFGFKPYDRDIVTYSRGFKCR